jgi:hypothetical protein
MMPSRDDTLFSQLGGFFFLLSEKKKKKKKKNPPQCPLLVAILICMVEWWFTPCPSFVLAVYDEYGSFLSFARLDRLLAIRFYGWMHLGQAVLHTALGYGINWAFASG